jgi:hypothetical protein
MSRWSGAPRDEGVYIVFDRKYLNSNNSNGFSRFYCVEELPVEAENEARRTEILGWRPKSGEIFALDMAPDLWQKNLRCIPKCLATVDHRHYNDGYRKTST